MTKKYDMIKLNIIEPDKNEDSWLAYNRCQILLNGTELLNIITEIEKSYFKTAVDLNENNAGQYIYMMPSELYDNLIEAELSNGKKDAHILCCTCGESGCSSTGVKVIRTKDSIIWKDFRTIRNWDFKLFYEFQINEYNNFLNLLKQAQDR
ncbi:MAG: hypothetical protein LUG16_01175 [Candidatus Gastranaerophilales bacterium]|nr:hypothetical protein [Candidatus Gastranaerophilales bacterium]